MRLYGFLQAIRYTVILNTFDQLDESNEDVEDGWASAVEGLKKQSLDKKNFVAKELTAICLHFKKRYL